MNEVDRFWSKVEKTDGCWLWTGGTFNTGYGQFKTSGPERQPLRAHRYAYTLSRGLPWRAIQGKIVRHRCDTPLCVNPEHLELGSHADNVQDRVDRGRCADRRGEKHHLAKLTDGDIQEIRDSGESRRELARKFHVSPSTILDIIQRRTWTHL